MEAAQDRREGESQLASQYMYIWSGEEDTVE
jgi:hypothetical protein